MENKDKKIEALENIFNDLYSEIKGYSVSFDARKKHEGEIKDLLYGEVPFETVEKMLEICDRRTGNFYDLGSGTGRVIFSMYFLGNFNKCIGIELLEGLYDCAKNVKSSLNDKKYEELKQKETKVSFINDSFLDVDFLDADLVFINHPTSNEELHKQLEKKLENLKAGAIVITTIRTLKSDKFKKIKSESMEFGWGNSTAYFHVKL